MIISAIKGMLKTVKMRQDPNGYARSIGVKMGKGCRLINLQKTTFGSEPFLVTLGDDVSVSSNARFIAHDGGIHVFRKDHPDIDLLAPIVVGSNVFIGADAIILPGVTIGDNCVIGARAVVTKDIPSGSVAVGVPARPIGTIDDYWERIKDKVLHIRNMSPQEKQQFLKEHFGVKDPS